MKKTLGAMLLIIALIGGAVYAGYYFFFRENNTVVPAFVEGESNLVIGADTISGGEGFIFEETEVLLPFSTIKSHIDPNIYWDEALEKVTVTTKDRVIRMKTDQLEAMVNNEPISLDIPAREVNGIVYIPIMFLKDFYNLEVTQIKENNTVIIDLKNDIRQLAEPIEPKAVVRKGMSRQYPIIKKIDLESENPEDNALRIFEEYEKWYRVRTADGAVGYIEKRFVVVRRVFVSSGAVRESEAETWKPAKGKIGLVWDQMWTAKKPDLSQMDDMKSLDVISPTWLQLASESGKLTNRADPGYVEWAHNNGYKVWVMLNNDFGNTEMTSEFLNNTDSRDTLIKEVLAYCALYKYDGVNIDFENLKQEDRDALTQFVREITPFLREQGLVVSIDVNSAAYYDRKALGETVDYVAIMAYDQHWRGSPEAGSVAQLPWVEELVLKFMENIPPEKILLGMPFYTRLWKEEKAADGAISLSSQAISMETARRVLAENNAEINWDESSGQFYSEYVKDGDTYRVWIEDENSINLRLSLVHKYKLAGAAAWSRNFAEPVIWSVMENNLKELTSYGQWSAENGGENFVYNK